MMISEIRRTNARLLATKVGGQANFARKVGMSDSHITQLIGENPTKNIGNLIARRFEKSFDRSEGWLDALRTEAEFSDIIVPQKKTAEDTPSPYVPFSIDPLEVEIINSFRRATPAGKMSIRAACAAAEKE